jgi:hypothetical protein
MSQDQDMRRLSDDHDRLDTDHVVTLTAGVTAKSFCVPIPTEDFVRLTRSEDYWNDDKIPDQEHLDIQIRHLGGYNVEYNGHYGPNIFFDLAVSVEEASLPQIVALIQTHIEKLRP